AQRALDGGVDQLFRRHFVDVLVLHDRQDLREQPELLVGGAAIRALAGNGATERQREYDEQRADHERLLHPGLLAPGLTEPWLRVLWLALIAYLEIEPGSRQRAGVPHAADSLPL